MRPVGVAHQEASPIDRIIDDGARDLLREDDPISAEVWASGLLDAFESARRRARREGMVVPSFEEGLLGQCRQRHDMRSAVVSAAVAAVMPPPHDRPAVSIASELSRVVGGLPEWVRTVGLVEPSRGWVASDVYGDQDSLIVAYRQQGAPHEHALIVLVDHNLSGQAKDAWICANADDAVARWLSSDDPRLRVREEVIDEVLRRLRDAMVASDLWDGDVELRSKDFAEHRAMIWSRLRRAGLSDERFSVPEVSPGERGAIVAEFLASPEGRSLAGELDGTDIETLTHYLVDLRCDYEGRPLRWSPIVVSLVLGDLAPRKLLLDSGEAAALPKVVRALLRFSGARTGLDRAFVEESLVAVDQVEATFLERVVDPAAAGPAKAVLAELRDRGVDITDLEALKEALGQGVVIPAPRLASKRTRRAANASRDVVAEAGDTQVLTRFDALVAFYGEGRRLTQTGQPTLADARSLVAVLGTQDLLERRAGDRTYKVRSAAELAELAFTIRWALAAGALRKEHGKLRATTTWGKLDGTPLQRWVRAADALPSLGPLAGYHANNRYRGTHEILDELASGILAQLLRGPVPFEEALDWTLEEADATFEFLSPYMRDREHRRRAVGWDLDLLVRILSWAGVVTRIGAVAERDPWTRERLVGGRLQLTRVGRWWLEQG